jgi:hypothetical protein
MTLTDQIDEILYRSFRWMTIREISSALRVMFASSPPVDAIRFVLDTEPSFSRYGDQYCVNLKKRADRLVAKFGFESE